MSAATPRDLSDLLAPIPGPSPSGSDPRSDDSGTEFSALRDARNEARRIERRLIDRNWDPKIEPTPDPLPLWRSAAEKAEMLLTQQAKDIEVACCLLEAWVRLEGFLGLRGGLTLLRELIEKYWDTLYPLLAESEGASARTRFIDRLNGPLPEALLRVPITSEGSAGSFAAWQFYHAVELTKQGDRAADEGRRRMDEIKAAAAETDIVVLCTLLADLDGALKELSALDAAILQHTSAADAPATSTIADTIDGIQRAIRALAGDRIEAHQRDAQGGEVAGESAAPAAGRGGPIRSRQDAFRALGEVADFFERMDPQSLLAAHIRRILKLGKMSPVEYFTEILEDESARTQLFKQVGLSPDNKTST